LIRRRFHTTSTMQTKMPDADWVVAREAVHALIPPQAIKGRMIDRFCMCCIILPSAITHGVARPGAGWALDQDLKIGFSAEQKKQLRSYVCNSHLLHRGEIHPIA